MRFLHFSSFRRARAIFNAAAARQKTAKRYGERAARGANAGGSNARAREERT